MGEEQQAVATQHIKKTIGTGLCVFHSSEREKYLSYFHLNFEGFQMNQIKELHKNSTRLANLIRFGERMQRISEHDIKTKENRKVAIYST